MGASYGRWRRRVVGREQIPVGLRRHCLRLVGSGRMSPAMAELQLVSDVPAGLRGDALRLR